MILAQNKKTSDSLKTEGATGQPHYNQIVQKFWVRKQKAMTMHN